MIVAVEFVAVLDTVTLPVTVPVAAGANVTFRVAVCPAVRIVPEGTPLTEKPAPEMLVFEMVIPDAPALVSVTVFVLLPATVTFPKAKDAWLRLSRRVPGFGVGVGVGVGPDDDTAILQTV